jgi:hypothetical protein
MANRDILKEAIADAKAIKETAIANAKVALEETFTPYLKEKLAAKLAEIDENMDEEDITEEMDMDEESMYENEDSMDELDLDELLRELNDMEEVINDPRGQGAHGNVTPSSESDTDLMEAEEAEEEEEEEFDIEDMTEKDLKNFIEDVISDMIEAGELEAGHEGMEDEMGAEDEIEVEDEEEEEINLDELLAEMYDDEDLDEAKDLKPDAYYEKHDRTSKASKHKRDLPKFQDVDFEAYYEMKEELNEAYRVLAKVKSELSEVNLLNSKLLYANKVFKAKNLSESQKVKVLTAFDKATSKKEARLVYETMMENLNTQTTTKRPMTESVRGMASKVIAGAQNTKQPIIEVNSAFERMQKLAGIKK